MANEDESVWVTFNGEIYNYRELRQQLIARGHRFRTQSDTEVILHGFEEWGDDCVHYFRGMFAFAVHDNRNHKVFLARDRFGIKPLVYFHNRSIFAFASELQSLEQLDQIELRLDHSALLAYLRLQYIPAPLTIFQGIKKLEPGCAITVDVNTLAAKHTRYWKMDFPTDSTRSLDDWVEELDHEIRESVRMQLRSDVPFGAFLSGGVDSSLVTAYMAEILDEPVNTFSIGFEPSDASELPFAKVVADQCRTKHRTRVLGFDAISLLPELVKHYGEPFGDTSAIPTYYVSKIAREDVTMVLSGDGGDELFCGYSKYLDVAGAWLKHEPLQGMEKVVARSRRSVGRLLEAARLRRRVAPSQPLNRIQDKAYQQFIGCSTVFSMFDACRLMKSAPYRDPAGEMFQHSRHAHRELDFASQMQLCDIENYLPGAILTKVDIASMMHGLEVRVPLLDHRVAEIAGRIPAQMRAVRSRTGIVCGKHVLKSVAERFFPRSFLDRPKCGFGSPLQQWLVGENLSAVQRRLMESGSRLGDLVHLEGVTELVTLQESTGYYWWHLWLLLFLAEWLDQHPTVLF